MKFKEKLILWTAMGGGLGRIPRVPGTFGTLGAIPFIILFERFAQGWATIGVVALMVVSIWICDRAEAIIGSKDPGCIVLDEVAGYTVAMAGMPVTFSTLAAGFILFRFFDIVKPGPVRYFERRFIGGPGIVLDDIVAGLLSAVVLRILFKLM
ncbi:MAG: phosphatidylglycerophosphatase A [Desulfobacterium sp.]|jgi:phosphatidylglycerophosphatase A|nr:phosphatidylglycerophosphatase A [Desulfobacterium sp.]